MEVALGLFRLPCEAAIFQNERKEEGIRGGFRGAWSLPPRPTKRSQKGKRLPAQRESERKRKPNRARLRQKNLSSPHCVERGGKEKEEGKSRSLVKIMDGEAKKAVTITQKYGLVAKITNC